MKTPRLIVLAGPNGAGKSTFARQHIIGRVPFVNADDFPLHPQGLTPGG